MNRQLTVVQMANKNIQLTNKNIQIKVKYFSLLAKILGNRHAYTLLVEG